MSVREPVELGLLAKLVIALAVLLLVSGVLMHGIHLDALQRLWHDLIERPEHEMSFRFILQPTTAAIAALHDGVKDARTGRLPFISALLHRPHVRAARLREAVNSTARLVLIGIVIDAIYQWKVLGTFHPIEALDIAILLAFVPYLLLRGPIARIAARLIARKATPG